MPYFVITLLSWLLVSCGNGPRSALKTEDGRHSYNISIQRTNNEQMLLNLVRLRYCEMPYFLDVSHISSEFLSKGPEQPSLPGLNQPQQPQPRIQYNPIEGESFSFHFMQPFSLSIIQNLLYAGHDIKHLFSIVFQDFDEEVLNLMQKLQVQKQLQTHLKGNALRISFPETALDAARLAASTQAILSKGYYSFDLQAGECGTMARSLLSCMGHLSLGIDPPLKDKGQIVDHPLGKEKLLHIKSRPRCPNRTYLAIQHRNHWFYIDDGDMESKKTFVLLMQLYNLQSFKQRLYLGDSMKEALCMNY